MSGNAIREAFLDFVKEANMLEEAYAAHIYFPHFILILRFNQEEMELKILLDPLIGEAK